MNDKQKELQDSAMSAAGQLAQIAKRRPLTPSEQNRLMSALQQARMACDAAGLVDKETQGSPKLDELSRLLEELCLQSNRKAVIFSQWALMTEMVESQVRAMGLGCVRLHGGVPSRKRGELMDRYLHDDAVQIFISTDAGGVGLNLQSATVLINLDMPWNPAVLDQRIARIHRLGQKQNVQIFLLLAEDSYEQRVARLVQGKRDLFDNVISPDASEDVVGVSQKMLQTLIDDLAGVEPGKAEGKASSEALDAPVQDGTEFQQAQAVKKPGVAEMEEDDRIRQLIAKIQAAYNGRLVRILGSCGGLLAVVDQIRDGDEESAQSQSEPDVPVVVIDSRTLAGLLRLGAASPVADSRSLYESEVKDRTAIHPLLKSAEAKLRSAEILLEQQASDGVMDLLAASMLTAAAAMAGLRQVPAADTAAIWLYSEALPKQLLTQEQAAAIVRAVSLSRNQDVPLNLIEQSLADARLLCSTSSA
ncbi:MAG: DEAD/DEAH box helicase [Gammaproteobacteria bacterium]